MTITFDKGGTDGIYNPTKEQFKELMQHPHKGPIAMVNLLKINPDGGRELYEKYRKVASKIIAEKLGGRVIYIGD